MTFEDFIMEARALNASDIHLTVGAPTVVRVNGELRKFGELSDMVVNRTILSILRPTRRSFLLREMTSISALSLKTVQDSVSTYSARAEDLPAVSDFSITRYPHLKN